MDNNVDQTLQTIEWIKEHTKGLATDKPLWDIRHGSNLTLNIYRPQIDYFITKPQDPIPETFNPEVTVFLISSD